MIEGDDAREWGEVIDLWTTASTGAHSNVVLVIVGYVTVHCCRYINDRKRVQLTSASMTNRVFPVADSLLHSKLCTLITLQELTASIHVYLWKTRAFSNGLWLSPRLSRKRRVTPSQIDDWNINFNRRAFPPGKELYIHKSGCYLRAQVRTWLKRIIIG